MRKLIRRFISFLLAFVAAVSPAVILESCGTLRTHWDVDHEFDFDDGSYIRREPKHHKRHKPRKHGKHRHDHHDKDHHGWERCD